MLHYINLKPEEQAAEWGVWPLTEVLFRRNSLLSYLFALSSLLPLVILVFLAGLAAAPSPRRTPALALLLLLIGNSALNVCLKQAIGSPRLPHPAVGMRYSTVNGMPSDHAQFMAFFVTYLMCAKSCVDDKAAATAVSSDGMKPPRAARSVSRPTWRQACFFFLTAAFVTVGRVYNGYHNVAQVLVGGAIGVCNALLCRCVFVQRGVLTLTDTVIVPAMLFSNVMMKAGAIFKELVGGPGLMENLSNYVIRPPRSDYEMAQLGPAVFRIGDDASARYRRVDLELENMRGMTIQCSWFRPYTKCRLPCIVYCHGNCGSRRDGLEALFLLQHGFTLFTFDCCGSGMSEGRYISLGFYERQDLAAVIEYLTSMHDQVDGIALWGRSMGAVTAIMYAAKDPSIQCIVCDTPFASLRSLISDLVVQNGGQPARYIPNFVINGIVERIRNNIMRLAAFDIDDLDTVKYASECAVPALIVHGSDDTFVLPRQSRAVRDAFLGPCLHEVVAGTHNDERDTATEELITAFLQLYLVEKRHAADAPRRRSDSAAHDGALTSQVVVPFSEPARTAGSPAVECRCDDGNCDAAAAPARRGTGVGQMLCDTEAGALTGHATAQPLHVQPPPLCPVATGNKEEDGSAASETVAAQLLSES